MNGRRRLLAAASTLVVLAALCVSPRVRVAVDTLPARLSDQAFWGLVEDFSEPGGYFRSDNLISNEDTFQHVIPELRKRLAPGGVYLGVGPDQNFTYIAALQPKMAFIVDIRRQNMLLHLIYKALMELSSDRAELLSRLFSRRRPPGLSAGSSAGALFEAYEAVPASNELFQQNLRAIIDRLVTDHGFRLSAEDTGSIEYVYGAFYRGGPDLRYSFPRQFGGGRWFPSYAELMMETDTRGDQHSYLANEENFQILRACEQNNLLVPVVGDFGGGKALKAVGRYLKDHGATVSLFYTSNVEQYLFQGNAWKSFFANVATLPIDDRSVFLRASFNSGFRYGPPVNVPNVGGRSAMLLDPVGDLLDAVRSGHVKTYYDVIRHSK